MSSLVNERVDIFVSPAKVLSGKDVNLTLLFLRALVNATYKTPDESRQVASKVCSLSESDLYKEAVRTRNTVVKVQAIFRKRQIQKIFPSIKGGHFDVRTAVECHDSTEERTVYFDNRCDRAKSNVELSICTPENIKKDMSGPSESLDADKVNQEICRTIHTSFQCQSDRVNKSCIGQINQEKRNITCKSIFIDDEIKRINQTSQSNYSESTDNSKIEIPTITKQKSSIPRRKIHKECWTKGENEAYDMNEDLKQVNDALDDDLCCLKAAMENEKDRQIRRLQERLNKTDTRQADTLEYFDGDVTIWPPLSAPAVLTRSPFTIAEIDEHKRGRDHDRKLIDKKKKDDKKDPLLQKAAQKCLNENSSYTSVSITDNKNEILMKKLEKKESKLNKKMEQAKEREDQVQIQELRVQRLAEQLRRQKEKFKKQKQDHELILDNLRFDSEKRKRRLDNEKAQSLKERDTEILRNQRQTLKLNSNLTDMRLNLERRERKLRKREMRVIMIERKLRKKLSIVESNPDEFSGKIANNSTNKIEKIIIDHTHRGTSSESQNKIQNKNILPNTNYRHDQENKSNSNTTKTKWQSVEASSFKMMNETSKSKGPKSSTKTNNSFSKDPVISSKFYSNHQKSCNMHEIQNPKKVKFYCGTTKRVEEKSRDIPESSTDNDNELKQKIKSSTVDENKTLENKKRNQQISQSQLKYTAEKKQPSSTTTKFTISEHRNGSAIESVSQAASRYKGFDFSFDKEKPCTSKDFEKGKRLILNNIPELGGMENLIFQ